MIHLDLTREEQEVLRNTLESYLSDLRYEIADTDRLEFREQLKAKKAVLEKILATLQTSA
ncbi:MAG: hypothetical protein ACE5ET_09480 [Gammaproteobacteria bacterium]